MPSGVSCPAAGCTDIVDRMNCNLPDEPSVHFAPADPGTIWSKDSWIAVDLDPDDPTAKIVTPNVVALPGGGYRMYYTALWYGTGYTDSTAVIRSAVSADTITWRREPGERLVPGGPDGDLRVLCPDVVPRPGGGYRMYFEAGSRDRPTVVLSAISGDGLAWEREDGIRVGDAGNSLGSPRCVYAAMPGRAAPCRSCRLYYHCRPFPDRRGVDAGHAILSAFSDDGVRFEPEPGVRIAQESDLESFSLYAPEVLRLGDGGYRMYYAGWSQDPWHGRIFTALSADGLTWRKDPVPCLQFGGTCDAVKVSEPCVIGLPDGRYRMFYEGCDEDGNWRILSALSDM